MLDLLFVIIVVLVGIVLMVVELFLLPGFGIAGVTGLLCMGGGICIAYLKIGAMAGHLTLGISLLFLLISIIVFLKSRALEKMALDAKIDSSVGLADPGKKLKNLQSTDEEQQKKQ